MRLRLLSLSFSACLARVVSQTTAAEPPITAHPYLQDFRDTFIQVEVQEKEDVRKTANNVRAIAVAADDTIWAATAVGLRHVYGDTLVAPEGTAVEGSTYDVLADSDG